jgi:hypothetical protein
MVICLCTGRYPLFKTLMINNILIWSLFIYIFVYINYINVFYFVFLVMGKQSVFSVYIASDGETLFR